MARASKCDVRTWRARRAPTQCSTVHWRNAGARSDSRAPLSAVPGACSLTLGESLLFPCVQKACPFRWLHDCSVRGCDPSPATPQEGTGLEATGPPPDSGPLHGKPRNALLTLRSKFTSQKRVTGPTVRFSLVSWLLSYPYKMRSLPNPAGTLSGAPQVHRAPVA